MKDLTKLLETLALQLGTTTEYLWTIMIKQAKIAIITESFFIVVSMIIIYFSIKYFKWANSNWQELYKHDREFIHVIFTIILSVNNLSLERLSGNSIKLFLLGKIV